MTSIRQIEANRRNAQKAPVQKPGAANSARGSPRVMHRNSRASVLVKNYLLGNTSLETYTKSVKWPSKGLFVGDPLARPFGTRATLVNAVLSIESSSLEPGIAYSLSTVPSATTPFSRIAMNSIPNHGFATININGMSAPFYKLELGGAFGVPLGREGTEMPSPARRSYPLSE
jgi:hypothetical protein